MPSTSQNASRVIPNARKGLSIAFILTSVLGWSPGAAAEEPPVDLARKVAGREALSEAERQNYTYRQTMVMDELDKNGAMVGEYREVRDVVFSPSGERSEVFIEKPRNGLKRLKLTEEDFRDLRDVQPFLFTLEQVWLYETKFKGEEKMDGVDCFLLQVRPRQIFPGQRLFDGVFWVDKRDFSIIRSEGQAVPQIFSTKADKENLFPHFTTLREKTGDFWFPAKTYAEDTLYFMRGAQRIRMIVRYSSYKKFGAESKIIPQ